MFRLQINHAVVSTIEANANVVIATWPVRSNVAVGQEVPQVEAKQSKRMHLTLRVRTPREVDVKRRLNQSHPTVIVLCVVIAQRELSRFHSRRRELNTPD